MNPLIQAARECWPKAQILLIQSPWNGEPKACHLVQEIRKESPAIEEELWNLVFEENLLLSAYSMHALYQRMSSKLAELPDSLHDRKGNITKHIGSFRQKQDYPSFVREMRKAGKAFKTQQIEVGDDSHRTYS